MKISFKGITARLNAIWTYLYKKNSTWTAKNAITNAPLMLGNFNCKKTKNS